MPYATQAEIEQLYGTEQLEMAAPNADGSDGISASTVTIALVGTSGEIDLYIGKRYDLPLTRTVEYLKVACIDITLYRLCLSRDKLTEEMRLRYEDHIKKLEKIAAGKMDLAFSSTDIDGNVVDENEDGIPDEMDSPSANEMIWGTWARS